MIRVAIIGAGHWGPNLIRNFHNRQTSEVVRVVDLDTARLADVRARFPEVSVGTDPEEAISCDDVDAIVVATPTQTHYDLAKAALHHAKHVFVEKPLTTDVAQGDDLCALAAERNRVLLVGHVFLYNPGVRKVKELIDDGELGRPYYISMARTNLGPIRTDVDAAWDLAAHDISVANYWLGRQPETVSAVSGCWLNSGIADAVFATARYPDNVLVSLQASWLNPRKNRDVTVVGEKRMLTFDDLNLAEPVRIYDKQVTNVEPARAYVDTFASYRSNVRDGDIRIPKVALGEPLRAECEHFLDCISNGTRPITGGPEGIAVVRVLDAIQRSAADAGREVPVDGR